jgi:hypothetical protein
MHTPGPWATEASINTDASDLVIVTKDYEYRIADTYVPSHHDGMAVPIEEAEANARLIAAAPELLIALDRILRAHESGNNGAVMGEVTLCEFFVDTARAAIAKAKGEA